LFLGVVRKGPNSGLHKGDRFNKGREGRQGNGGGEKKLVQWGGS